MLNRICLMLVLNALMGTLSAQILLYPVRQDHRWGFMTARGRLMIEPRYQAFSETNLPWNLHPEQLKISPSDYRLVEFDGSVGLLDRNLRETLPCRFKRIRPLSRHYFAVETDSLFKVTDRKGSEVLSGAYDDICAADTSFSQPNEWLLLKKRGRWGLWQRGKGVVIEPQYDDIAWAGKPDYFRVKPNNKIHWGLINAQNRVILPAEYADLVVAHPNCILTRDPVSNLWGAVDGAGNPLFDFVYRSARPINRFFIWLIDTEQKPALWNINRREWADLTSGAGKFGPLDENYLVCSRFRKRGIMDSTGTIVLRTLYDSIIPSGLPNCYRVLEYERYWGLIRLGEEKPLMSFRFSSFESFSEGIAIVCTTTGCGAVNERFEEVIPYTFERVEREGDTLQAFDKEDKMFRFRLLPGGKVMLLDNFDEVLSIKVGGDLTFIEAKPIRKVRRSVLNLPDTNAPLSRADSTLFWQKDPLAGHWQLIRRNAEGKRRLYADQLFQEIKPLTPGDMTAVYHQDRPVNSRFSKLFGRKIGRLCRMSLFSLQAAKMPARPEWIGIRRTDFEQNLPCAVVIDTLGRMGLVTQRGETVRRPDGLPLKFTYIGEFSNGKARVCAGGILRLPEPEETFPAVEPFSPFPRRYELIEPVEEQLSGYDDRTYLIIAPTEKSKPLWGYIDTLGNVLMAPTFDFADDFSANQVAIVRQGAGYGLINSTFMTLVACNYRDIVPISDSLYKVSVKNPYIFYFSNRGRQYCLPQYNRYMGFSGGRCAVRRDSLWGFLDDQGKESIPCRFEAVRPFSDGLAAVLDTTGWVFVGTTGRKVFGTGLPRAGGRSFGAFSEGRCAVQQNRKWGYWDKAGQLKIEATFAAAGPFHRGAAVVKSGNFYGLIDTAGQYILKPERFAVIEEFNAEGVAKVKEKKEGFWGLLDTKGNLLTALKYIEIDTFRERHAKVRATTGHGLVNTLGREVIPCGQYAGVGRVSGGVAAVLPPLAKAWSYVDTTNRRISERTFMHPGPFQGGYALVEQNQVIDRSGQSVELPEVRVEFLSEGIFGMRKSSRGAFFANAAGDNLFGRYYDDMKPFQQGIAKIKKGTKWGAINERGVPLVQTKFNFVHLQKDGNLIVRPPVLFGVVSKSGRVVAAPEYDLTEWMQGGILKMELGEKVGYMKPDGVWVREVGN